MPLPALGQLFDRLLEKRIMDFLALQPAVHAACFIGGAPGTQPLDIAGTVQLAMGKMCDKKSEGCVSQCDVGRFYDTIDLLAVVGDMERRA